MLKNFKKFDTKHTGLFAAGVLFGTAGIKILASEDARKLYANCTAAVLPAGGVEIAGGRSAVQSVYHSEEKP